MRIEIDENSGFCFGVRNAVAMAEKTLMEGEKLYSLGQIVHNDIEVERLHNIGLVTIDHEKFRKLKNSRVFIRAHGEPPEIYRIAKTNGITLIDATCPIVKQLQQKIRKIWQESKTRGGQIVIFGKPGHAEVIGLLGQTDNQAIVTDGETNIDKIDFTREIHIFSQTTMNVEAFNGTADKIKDKIKQHGIKEPERLLNVYNTICGQVSHRQPFLEKFAENHNVIIFVSGKESSNGRMLFDICKKKNPFSYFVSSPEDLKKEWFEGKKSAGICGATSTPKWLMKEVKDAIASFEI